MLWSLVRILLFIAAVTVAAFVTAFLVEAGGEVRVAFAGREYTFEPLVAIIGILLLMVAIWLAVRLFGLLVAVFRFFNGDETAITRYLTRNRRKKGFDALTESLAALAAGDGQEALRKALRAERYLDHNALTLLVSAEAAELAGDRKQAIEHYKQLVTDDRTRFAGIVGLMRQKLAEGDRETALKLAEKAFALNPRHAPTLETLFELRVAKGDWAGARKVIEAMVRANVLPRDVARRREAVVALADARALLEAGEVEEAKQAVLHANTLAPDFVPAAQLAAEMLVLDGNTRAATKILKRAWAANPHPDLAKAFAEIEPGESPEQRLKRFQQLIRQNPDHPESRLLEAELLLAVEDFPAARRALGKLAERHPTARALAIMAAIEKGEGADEKVVRAWLAKAVSAPRGPQWVCEKCGKVHAEWVPRCEQCGAFDSLAWMEPPAEAEAARLPVAPAAVAKVIEADTPSAPVEEAVTAAVGEETKE